MVPLQFRLVPVTLHGCEQVNTEPFGQSSSHPVRAWLAWLSFAWLSFAWLSFAWLPFAS
jgi:hypothetical protein